MRTEFTLQSLQDLDMGKADIAVREHLRRVALDIKDRPMDPATRKVVIEIGIKPDADPDGSCDRVKTQIQVTSTVPRHRTRVHEMALHTNGALSFNADSPDNVDQETMDFDKGD